MYDIIKITYYCNLPLTSFSESKPHNSSTVTMTSKSVKKNSNDETKLKNYFLKKIRAGNILNSKNLRKYAKQRKLNVSRKYIATIRDKVIPTLLFKRPVSIKNYQTVTIPKLGLLSMDFAYYPDIKSNWKRFNGGHIGFLMINSVIAKKQLAVPMKSRTSKEFEKVLEKVCRGNYFPAIETILSDRETAITSPKFRKLMFEKYGIKFNFITRYNKAWSSEAAIHVTKDRLSQALVNNGKKWLALLEEVINTHNRTVIEGTTFTPNQINFKNFYDYLKELHDFKDVTMSFNTNSIDSRSIIQDNWIKKIFKFNHDDRVFASNYALEGRKVFGKQSVRGTFSKTPFVIKRIKLRHTTQNKLVPGTLIFFTVFFFS